MKRELTFQKGKTASGHQWCKTIKGRRHYFGPARSRENKEDYLAAFERYRSFLAQTPPEQTPTVSERDSSNYEHRFGARQTGRIANLFYAWNQSRIWRDDEAIRPKGTIGSNRAGHLRRHVGHFVNWYGERVHLSKLTSADLIAFSNHLSTLGHGHNHQQAIKASVKMFLLWAYESELLDRPPRALFTKTRGPLSVNWLTTPILTFSWRPQEGYHETEIQRLYLACRNTSPDAELFFLLATNCGFTQIDMATLRWEHIRRRTGGDLFVERARNKTGVLGQHLLWRRTKELLLQRTRGSSPTGLVITTSTNRSHYRLNSNGSVTSGIPQTMKRVIRKTFGADDTRSLKHLRKTGASFCAERSPGVDALYLVHSPRTMAAKHYSLAPFASLSRVLIAMESQFLGVPFNTNQHKRYAGH